MWAGVESLESSWIKSEIHTNLFDSLVFPCICSPVCEAMCAAILSSSVHDHIQNGHRRSFLPCSMNCLRISGCNNEPENGGVSFRSGVDKAGEAGMTFDVGRIVARIFPARIQKFTNEVPWKTSSDKLKSYPACETEKGVESSKSSRSTTMIWG